MARNFTMIFYGPKESIWALVAPGGASRGHNSRGCARAPWRAQVGCTHLGGLPYPFFAL